MQALPNMLEIVPRGWNKWASLQHLLADLKVGQASLEQGWDGCDRFAPMEEGTGVDSLRRMCRRVVHLPP